MCEKVPFRKSGHNCMVMHAEISYTIFPCVNYDLLLGLCPILVIDNENVTV